MADFDLEFEESILAQCFRDEKYLKSAVRVCLAHHFGTPELSWVWKVVHDVWQAHRERVNPKLVLARAHADFPDEAKRKPHLALAVKLFRMKPAAPKAALEELTRFVRFVNAQLAIEEAARGLEKGKLIEAESALARASRTTFSSRPWTHLDWFGSFVERQKARKYEREHPEEFTVIPTGIPRLDRALSGGARVGEVGLILGTTGQGKSILLNNLCHASIRRGFGAVYFALEMHARQIATRTDSCWSGLRYDQFKTFNFKPSEMRVLIERYKKFARRYRNKFHIVSMPIKSADVRTLEAALDDLRNEFDFTPSLVAVDSGDHMRAIDKSLDSYRLQQAEVYWNLKALAEEQGCVLWSTVHAGREWANQIATSEAASESYDKSRIADLIVSINDPNGKPGRRKKAYIDTDDEDEDEPGEVTDIWSSGRSTRELELYLAKYRDGESKLRIDIAADFARMTLKQKDDEENEDADAAA